MPSTAPSNPTSVRPILFSILVAFSLVLAASLWLIPGHWQSLSERISGRIDEAPSLVPSVALALEGGQVHGIPLAARRDQTLEQLKVIMRAQPALIVMEDWLDISSQEAAETLVKKLMSTNPSNATRRALEEAEAELGSDRRLAAGLVGKVPVLLPLGAARGAADGAFRSLSETVAAMRSARSFKVKLKHEGRQNLHRHWQINRQPIPGLLEAAAGSAMVEDQLHPGENLEANVVFGVRGRWVPSLGLEALLRYWEIPRKGLRFLWNKKGELSYLELKGFKHPLNAGGAAWLPANESLRRVPRFPVSEILVNSDLRRLLGGKVIFYRPWPADLEAPGVFDRQRQLFASLLNESLSASPASIGLGWGWAAGLVVFFVVVILLGQGKSWMGLGIFSLVSVGLAGSGQGDKLFVAGLILSAAMWCWGLKGLRGLKVSQAGESLFHSVTAPGAAQVWRERFKNPEAGGSVRGVYLVSRGALRPGAEFEAWAERTEAFLDPGEREGVALFLPLERQGRIPLDDLWSFYEMNMNAALTFSLGDIVFEPSVWMGQFRWGLAGRPKDMARALVKLAEPDRMVCTETEYQLIRKRVKIQLLGEQDFGASGRQKIFRILEIGE